MKIPRNIIANVDALKWHKHCTTINKHKTVFFSFSVCIFSIALLYPFHWLLLLLLFYCLWPHIINMRATKLKTWKKSITNISISKLLLFFIEKSYRIMFNLNDTSPHSILSNVALLPKAMLHLRLNLSFLSIVLLLPSSNFIKKKTFLLLLRHCRFFNLTLYFSVASQRLYICSTYKNLNSIISCVCIVLQNELYCMNFAYIHIYIYIIISIHSMCFSSIDSFWFGVRVRICVFIFPQIWIQHHDWNCHRLSLSRVRSFVRLVVRWFSLSFV